MRGLRGLAIIVFAVCWVPPAVQAQTRGGGVGVIQNPSAPAPQAPAAAPASREVEIRSWVDKTALWAGDHVTFTVEIECAPHVDILTDDLAKEKLKLTGLELVSADSGRTLLPSGGVAYRFVYELATYEVGATGLQIDDLPVRYYVRRPEQRIDKVVPSGEALVTGMMLAWRSTLPDVVANFGLRDQRRPSDLPAALAFARPAAIGLLLVSAAPIGIWVVPMLWRMRPRHVRSHAREARRLTRAALDELQGMDVSGEAARKNAYGRLDALLRQHVAGATGISAGSLTAREIARRLSAKKSRIPAETVAEPLDQCEQARYGPPGQVPSVERFREALASTEQLIAGRSRGGLTSFFR